MLLAILWATSASSRPSLRRGSTICPVNCRKFGSVEGAASETGFSRAVAIGARYDKIDELGPKKISVLSRSNPLWTFVSFVVKPLLATHLLYTVSYE